MPVVILRTRHLAGHVGLAIFTSPGYGRPGEIRIL